MALRRVTILALVINLTFTPYANDSHFILLLPAWVWLIGYDRRWLAAWGLSWLVLLRLVNITGEITFLLVVMAGVLCRLAHDVPCGTHADVSKGVDGGTQSR